MRSLPVVRGVSRTSTFPGPLRMALCTLLVVAGLGVFADDASAQRRFRPWRADEAKFDTLLKEMASEDDDLPVIVEFNDDRNADEAIGSHGRRSERRLSSMRGRSTRMSKRLLRQLARRGDVKRVHFDRPVETLLGRSSITVGAKTVQALMGFDGKGIGVAVIDSGVTPSHDDLRYAGSTTQRVTKFVDFVNGQTARYDDWGHGTHVAGIVAGNGYDSHGTRAGIAPGATLVALKALDGEGRGRISYIIQALDWAVANRAAYNIRVINMSLGAGVFESYNTDPLTLAAKRAVDAGIVVVAAAGNIGRNAAGDPQYGAITAPANAPWVLTVGASNANGTIRRNDDTVAPFSSRGPTMHDRIPKPDLVAPGTGVVSLSSPGSKMYVEKAQYLVNGSRPTSFKPYLTLSGTSMATPVVSGTVALMLQANPSLTPNLVKAILQYTSEVRQGYDFLTQGAGFLNSRGAVTLAKVLQGRQARQPLPAVADVEPAHPVGQPSRVGRRDHAERHGLGRQHRVGRGVQAGPEHRLGRELRHVLLRRRLGQEHRLGREHRVGAQHRVGPRRQHRLGARRQHRLGPEHRLGARRQHRLGPRRQHRLGPGIGREHRLGPEHRLGARRRQHRVGAQRRPECVVGQFGHRWVRLRRRVLRGGRVRSAGLGPRVQP